MKRYGFILTIPLFFNAARSYAADAPVKEVRQVSVQGTAKIQADPDMARISIEVTEDGTQTADLTASVRKKMEAVLTAVKAQGVHDSDLQTKQYRVTPKTRWDNGRGLRGDGYTVSDRVEIFVRDLKQTGAILTAATDAGANAVDGPQFDIENPTLLERQVLRLAMEDAKARAAVLAEAAGAALGPATSINENRGFIPGPRPLRMRGAALSASAPEPIESGQQEISATVNATFALR